MFAHNAVRLAAIGLRGISVLSSRCRFAALIILLASTVSGCTIAASKDATPHPADPAARIPLTTYRSVTGGYTSQRPAEPQSWRERNERVTPEEKR